MKFNILVLIFISCLLLEASNSEAKRNSRRKKINRVGADSSCIGRCTIAYDATLPCQCNSQCESFSDCCSDYATACSSADTSCVGRCNVAYDSSLPCQCNDQCESFSDCCSDYTTACGSAETSCNGRCTIAYDASLPCQCNDQCESFSDCCSDYSTYCTSSGSITDQEIYDISTQIWTADAPNRLAPGLDWQGQTSDGSTADLAPGPLCATIPNEVNTNPLYVDLTALFDNYVADENYSEDITAQESNEIDAFLTQVMATETMQLTNTFLASKGLVPSDATSFQAKLKEIWYTLYDRQKTTDSSSGAEHVQLGEKESGNTINGLHNWVRFCSEETAGHINYLGYVKYENIEDGTYVIRNPFYWDGYYKPVGGFFIGTSPAFDMSIFTLCFFARPDSICNTKLNGITVPIQTYTMDTIYVGTSYPNY